MKQIIIGTGSCGIAAGGLQGKETFLERDLFASCAGIRHCVLDSRNRLYGHVLLRADGRGAR